jgi:hypothetical protein
MSLWLQSLSFCLHDFGDDPELKAKCILSHLSMDIPRLWWEQALETKDIQNSHAGILNDLKKELLETPELIGKIDSGMLVALSFADKEGEEARFGNEDSPHTIQEYLDKAKKILTERPELCELGRLIDNAGK